MVCRLVDAGNMGHDYRNPIPGETMALIYNSPETNALNISLQSENAEESYRQMLTHARRLEHTLNLGQPTPPDCVLRPSGAADGSASSVADLINELIEMARPCNPQAPELWEFVECPEDHPFCCGRCELVHRARKWVSQNKASTCSHL